MTMRKPRALQPGDRIAIVAPASGFSVEEFHAGLFELESLDFVPSADMSVYERTRYTAGTPDVRADALRQAWADPEVHGIIAARGGYGSVHLLPLLRPSDFDGPAKPIVGYSDITSLLTWLTLTCGLVTFHGPMIAGRLSRGSVAYDRDTFARCLTRPAPVGRIANDELQVLRQGSASGMLIGGTMTQLAASLGTPFAFDPPRGAVLFLDDVGERPYRIDRLYTQLRLAGIIERASALVFNELPRCDEPGGPPAIRDVVADLTSDFEGPVLFGLRSGHTEGAMLTLPFGVTARVETGARPGLVIDESAVQG
jgi:muramoyltetrapeptide carboxypeptidase